MTVIASGSSGIVVLNVFTVEPSGQEPLLAHLCDVTESLTSHQPGFVSANLHRSYDGLRVADYTQWQSRSEYEAMLRAFPAATDGLPQRDGSMYRVAHVETAGPVVQIVEGTSPLTLIVVMTCDPGKQSQLTEYLITIAQEHSHNDGFVSCTIHESLDATRIAEYIQWRDQAALSAMMAKPSSQAHFTRARQHRSVSARYAVTKTALVGGNG